MKIKKSTGENERFSEEKLRRSLKRAGADRPLIDAVVKQIERDLHNGLKTQRIHKQAFRHLKRLKSSVAARYQLKKAVMELGPTGYPFERLMGEIFLCQGFEVEVGKIMPGHCVQHEVDVVGYSEDKLLLVECKYRNTPGFKCDVKVPLYIHSRFEDVGRSHPQRKLQPWIATNARFTKDAIAYGECVGIKLLGWDYPQHRGLKFMLDDLQLYPLTVLTCLSKSQKQQLLQKNAVLCRDLLENPDLLNGLPGKKPPSKQRVLSECEHLLWR